MRTEKEVQLEMDDLRVLKELVETYEEIAITRMRKIRNSVLISRDFSLGLAQVFGEVTTSYKQELEHILAKKKGSAKGGLNSYLLPNNGKTAAVFLSANTGLYGDIIQKTFSLFLDHIKNNPTEEVVVIGRLGQRLLKDSGYNKEVNHFDLSDGALEHGVIRGILEKLLAYQKILIFYGQFQSVVTQNAAVLDLYGAETPAIGGQSSSEPVRYLFEPTLENILEFFEKEILTSLFEQTVEESNLAKYASRMVSLDSATDNINGRIRDVMHQGRIVKHRNMNRKQLNTLTGFSLWTIS